jgi:hypothetical protein
MERIDDLNVCEDEGYADQSYLRTLKSETLRTNKMLNGYTAYLKKRKNEDA